MEARCRFCTDVAEFLITYEDSLGVNTQETACDSCADARSSRDDFDKMRLTTLRVDF